MDEIEEIKRRLDIIDLISSYLTVKKAGANYRALCPFHHEKTPSLMISSEKQIWKCFGCNEGGDIFTFVEKMENMGFREALEMLAQKAGVKLEKYKSNPTYQKEKDQKTRLFHINHWSARLFHELLMKHPSSKQALEYLTKKRKLTVETIKTFEIGYAPSPQTLKLFLRKKGFNDTEIQSAGGPDRFYRRIIFPIKDVMGNTVGFTGRATSDDQQPKYLNTPETNIFHKGRILYNLDKARGEIKIEKTSIVVEGQMDVIASWQAGVRNVVATSGTALTQEHLQILYRYTPNIIFSFDSDTAGLATAKKAYEMAIVEGMNVKMVEPIDGYKDPGEIAIADSGLWQKTVAEAKPVIDWYFNLAFKKPFDSAQGKKEVAKELLPVIKKVPDSIEQAHYVGLLARKLSVSENIIFDALEKANSKQSDYKKEQNSESRNLKALSAEEILVCLLISNPDKIGGIKEQISPDHFEDKVISNIYNKLILWYADGGKGQIELYLKGEIGQDFPKVQLLLLETKEKYPELTDQLLYDLVQKIKETKTEKIKNHFAEAIRQAEAKNDREKLKVLIKEFQDAIAKK